MSQSFSLQFTIEALVSNKMHKSLSFCLFSEQFLREMFFLQLAGKIYSLASMRAFMRFCYVGKIGAVSVDILQDLLEISKILELDSLSQLCVLHMSQLGLLVTSTLNDPVVTSASSSTIEGINPSHVPFFFCELLWVLWLTVTCLTRSVRLFHERNRKRWGLWQHLGRGVPSRAHHSGNGHLISRAACSSAAYSNSLRFLLSNRNNMNRLFHHRTLPLRLHPPQFPLNLKPRSDDSLVLRVEKVGQSKAV